MIVVILLVCAIASALWAALLSAGATLPFGQEPITFLALAVAFIAAAMLFSASWVETRIHR